MFAELCRLCERPAADGGHRAAELDKDKLAEWCLNFLGTTLAEEIDDQDLFCYFCVWDARLYHNSTNNAVNIKDDYNMCWWPKEDADKNIQELYKNYTAGKVQQCWVSLEKLPLQEKERSVDDARGKAESRFERNCCYCGKNIRKVVWYQHMQRNHADVAIRCNYNINCSKYFKTVEERDAHVKEIHLKPKVETLSDCIYCTKKGIKVEYLREHVKSKHRDVAIRCSNQNCALYFKTQDELDLHFETKHKSAEEKKKLKCSICDYKSYGMNNIENHEAKDHQVKKIIKCTKCPKSFSSKCDLLRHLNGTHNFRKCPACNFRIQLSKYYEHFTKRFCRKCKSGFDCSDLLRKHEKNCRHELKCELCLKSFRNKSLLQYHFTLKHLQFVQSSKSNESFNFLKSNKIESTSNKKWRCAHCSKELSSKHSIERHLANFHKLVEKKHCCNQCSAKFYDAAKLKYHMRDVHVNEKAKCKICDKEMQLGYLRKHMIIIHPV